MIDRRQFSGLVLAGAAAVSTPNLAEANDEPILGEDGLYHQSWFLESFLELADDLTEAGDNGKRFVVMWELKGCPYCRETHFVNFGRPDIRDFVKSKFEILQLNVVGDRAVVDFDGEELPEKKLAAKYGVRFTPTIQFFPPTTEGISGKDPRDREVARIPGYMKPDHFLKMFQFVESRAYENGSFRSYLKNT